MYIAQEIYGELKSKTVTVSKAPTGKHSLSILVEVNKNITQKKPIGQNKAAGIDLGIKTFSLLSNGEQIQNQKKTESLFEEIEKTK